MIEVKNLTKRFGAKTAVDNVSFTVEKGEILGFLGPNGAGKSTSMRMITGFLPPTRGTAVIGGDDIREAPIAARGRMGYLPENAPVYPDMTVRGYLDFCAEIRGFSGRERKKRVAETVDRCFLNGVEPQAIGTLSKGYRQRVCFAQSILHDPEYLIMDEPTDGLDPNQKHEVRQMIRRMSADKVILLSTHILDEVDAVCTRAIIIAGGRIAADDTPENLRARSAVHGALSLTLGPANPRDVLARVRKIEGVRDARLIDAENGAVNVRVFPDRSADPQIADRVVSAMSDGGFELRTLFVERGRLDEVFRTITTAQ
jgi:ABC-2 type transport system ATP-binding protein